ncbi:MAG: sigma-70 family RNA polymerase sigma factor [Acidobacteriota bacterium]
MEDLTLRRAKAGDLAAFEEIVVQHERQVFLTALRLLGRREDAQDAAQEVFIRLHRHLGRFDEDREFAPWLYRMTVNVCRDIGRKRRREETAPLEEGTARAVEDPHVEAVAAERRRIVKEGLRRLPEKERAALVLRDLEGLTTREVARVLGSTETTVRSQISSARLKLRKFAERYFRGRS